MSAPKRIYYIAFARIPTEKAHGVQILKTCEALQQAGTEVDLVIPVRKTPIQTDPFEYYKIKTRFPITKVNIPDFVSWGRIGFLLSLLFFSERAHFSKKFWSADAIYSRDALVLFQYILLGRPLVYEVHSKPAFISRIVARRAKMVIVISKALKAAYERVGVCPERICVVPDAVDLSLFDVNISKNQARNSVRLPQDRKIVMYVGHLYARKGARVLAQAVSELPQDCDVYFVGGTEKDISSFENEWKHESRIKIVGHQPFERIPLYMQAADVLVLPNSGKDEDAKKYTSPMKLFEYMASRVPIVASDVPSVREIASDAEIAFFTPDGSTSLAQTISKVLDDGSGALRRVEMARKKVEEYTWENRAASIIKVL